MGNPKKRTSHRRTGSRRSHLVAKLARAVNAKSPVKALAKVTKPKTTTTKATKPATKPAAKAAKTTKA